MDYWKLMHLYRSPESVKQKTEKGRKTDLCVVKWRKGEKSYISQIHLGGAKRKPVRFHLDQSMEMLTAHSGLALIGQLLSHTQIAKRLIRHTLPGVHQPTVTHPDVMVAYLGLLCQGKSDFDQIEPFRQDRFFAKSLGVKHVPSSPTLRQRLDLAAASSYDWQTILLEESAGLLRSLEAPLTPVCATDLNGALCSWLPLDLDVSPFDNSNTQK
jgi:hypothetical protein